MSIVYPAKLFENGRWQLIYSPNKILFLRKQNRFKAPKPGIIGQKSSVSIFDSPLHKHVMQYAGLFHGCKNGNFQFKFWDCFSNFA